MSEDSSKSKDVKKHTSNTPVIINIPVIKFESPFDRPEPEEQARAELPRYINTVLLSNSDGGSQIHDVSPPIRGQNEIANSSFYRPFSLRPLGSQRSPMSEVVRWQNLGDEETVYQHTKHGEQRKRVSAEGSPNLSVSFNPTVSELSDAESPGGRNFRNWLKPESLHTSRYVKFLKALMLFLLINIGYIASCTVSNKI